MGRQWYSWVANTREEVVLMRTALFLDLASMGWVGRLVQFAWCWRSQPSLDRGLVCRDPSSFQGSTVGSVCRPISLCPSYPAASATPGLLAISSYIRFFKGHLYRVSSINAVAEVVEQAIFDSDAAVPFIRAYIAAGRAI